MESARARPNDGKRKRHASKRTPQRANARRRCPHDEVGPDGCHPPHENRRPGVLECLRPLLAEKRAATLSPHERLAVILILEQVRC